MEKYNIFFVLILIILFTSACRGKIIKNKENETAIELVQSDKVEVIKLKLNDSTYVRINIDSGINLRSIVWHKKGALDGESLVFYPNGKLEKKISNKDAIRNGHTQYFYESGALKSDLFYCRGKPDYYGVEYWNYDYSILKHVYIYGDAGKVEKIRNFDTSGNYLRDSIPPANSKYPDPINPDY